MTKNSHNKYIIRLFKNDANHIFNNLKNATNINTVQNKYLFINDIAKKIKKNK
jgi:hypothetical protein